MDQILLTQVIPIFLGVTLVAIIFRRRIRNFFRDLRAHTENALEEPGGLAKLNFGQGALKVLVLVLFVAALGVSALFVYKLSQTSSWALQFDDRVKASVGAWMLSTIALWACFLALGILAMINRGIVEEARATQINKIRQKLTEIETSSDPEVERERRRERVNLESRLRELGA